MKNKLTLKIGSIFFLMLITILLVLFYILYSNIVNNRVEEVMNELLARGNTHRDVLEQNYNKETLHHVGIMESASEFVVIITNDSGQIVVSSNNVEPEMKQLIFHTEQQKPSRNGHILEDDWEKYQYVATDSPITINNQHKGHVYMFSDSSYIKKVIHNLSQQFIWITLLSILLTIVIAGILTRIITMPLLTMIDATEKLSKGQHEVKLDTNRNDELGHLAQSITKLSEDLTRLQNERIEFLSSISHELRTPLTYLKGYSDILSRPGIPETDKVKYTYIIQEEATRLTELIKTLFDLAKMDQNQFVIHKKPVKIDNLITQVNSLLDSKITERNITFDVNYPADLIINVDLKRFQQVILNLLDNSIKYSPPNSLINLKVFQQSHEVVMLISDNGNGIADEDLPFIFDKLYRTEISRSRVSGGSGLGLSIAKEIVELHGGSIKVTSKLGHGTQFVITLGGYDEKDSYHRR